MNKTCARCQKIVYPIEELKCLDKTWHKTCFKCTECGMTLNMKTYKGYNKLPYCEAHIPKAKATAIADTPELKRIAENTKIQSNVKYHADFEKAKGKFTQVADDPETLRIKQNTKIISNVAYHGDLEKKAAMEKQREAAEVADSRGEESEYFSETLAAEQFSQYAPTATIQTAHSPPQQLSPPLSHQQQYQQQHTLPPPPIQHQQQNTAAIIASSQAATTQLYNQSNRQQQQQQQQHQQHYMQAPPQHQQQQHYQQPQALKQQYLHQQHQHQHQLLQSPTKSVSSVTKQTSHLYPAASPLQHQQQPPQQLQQNHNNPQQLQQHSSQATYQQQQQQQQQLQSSNSYNQLRSTILQNSHHPTGAALPTDASVVGTNSNTAIAAAAAGAAVYDQYDNYARPAAAYNVNNNVSSNNNIHASYQQQQQQQKPFSASNSATAIATATAAALVTAASNSNTNVPAQQLYASNTYKNPHSSSATSVASNLERQASHHSNGGLAVGSHHSNTSVHNNCSSSIITNSGNMTNSGSGGSGGPGLVSVSAFGSGSAIGTAISSSNIGKIADYDPLTDGPRQMPNTSRPSTTLIYSSDSRGSVNNSFPKRVGSIADIDPANGIYGSIAAETSLSQQQLHQQQQQQYYQQMQLMQQQQRQQELQMQQQHEQAVRQQQQQHQQAQQQLQQQQQQQTQAKTKPSLRVYHALYDYVAQDVDEVSFREGDVIFEVDSIDSGWMTGRVERTGETGMLPANYVVQAVI